VSARSASWAPLACPLVSSEGVSVSPKEADEHVFLFRVETHPDHGSLAAIARPEVDGLLFVLPLMAEIC
jgi:hypothetical protein